MNRIVVLKLSLILFLFLDIPVFGQDNSVDYTAKRDAVIEKVRQDYESILHDNPEEGLEFIRKSFQSYKNDPIIEAWSYYLIGDYYMQQYNDDSSIYYFEKSVKTFNVDEDPLLFSKNKNQIALIYAAKGQFEKSLEVLKEAKNEINDKSSNQVQIKYYQTLGQYYQYKSDIVKAIESYHKAEVYVNREPEGEAKDIELAKVYVDIGSVIFDKKKAAVYYKKARGLLEGKDKFGQHYCDLYIADLKGIQSTPLELNNLDTAVQYFKRVGATGQAINGMVSIAKRYSLIGNKKRAEAQFLEALELSRSIDYVYGIKKITSRLGALYNETGQYNKSITYALESFDTSSHRLDVQFSNLQTLYSAYKNKKDFKNAYFYLEEYLFLKEKSQDEEHVKITEELETKYKSERRQLQIQSLEKENNLIKQRRWLLAGLTALLLLIPILFLYQRSKKRKKIYQAKLAEMQLASLKSQMSPHFMFNSINTIKGMIVNDAAEAAADQLTKFSKFMRNILNYSGGESITLQEEMAFLRQYADLENFKREQNVDVIIACADGIELEHICVMPFLIQPFMENSFKHAFDADDVKPRIDINFTKQGLWLHVVIEDNGIGEKGAENVGHLSKGGMLVDKRLELHNNGGNNVKTKYQGKGKGTRVEVKIKINDDK